MCSTDSGDRWINGLTVGVAPGDYYLQVWAEGCAWSVDVDVH